MRWWTAYAQSSAMRWLKGLFKCRHRLEAGEEYPWGTLATAPGKRANTTNAATS